MRYRIGRSSAGWKLEEDCWRCKHFNWKNVLHGKSAVRKLWAKNVIGRRLRRIIWIRQVQKNFHNWWRIMGINRHKKPRRNNSGLRGENRLQRRRRSIRKFIRFFFWEIIYIHYSEKGKTTTELKKMSPRSFPVWQRKNALYHHDNAPASGIAMAKLVGSNCCRLSRRPRRLQSFRPDVCTQSTTIYRTLYSYETIITGVLFEILAFLHDTYDVRFVSVCRFSSHVRLTRSYAVQKNYFGQLIRRSRQNIVTSIFII